MNTIFFVYPRRSGNVYGISTFCLHKEPLESALETLAPMTDLVEIMNDGPHHIENTDLLDSYSISYSFHAPSRGVNIASVLEPIRQASVDVTGQCIALAGEVNGAVVVHPGYFAWEEEREKALKQFKKSLFELNRIASDQSVTYYLENMGNWNYFFLRFPDEMEILDGVGLALDVGHANLNACLDGFLSRPFCHVHLHDNDGKDDSHLPVGSGTIDFQAVIQALKREQAVPVIEVATLEGTQLSIRALEEIANRI